MSHSQKLRKLLPLIRAITVVSAVGVATSLVTFAAIQSTGNALTGNTIQTATASLQISTNGTYFTNTISGFYFSGLVPGGAAQPAANNYTVYLKNTGGNDLNLSLTVPTTPTVTGTVDLAKVFILLTPTTGSSATTQTFSLASLIAGKVTIENSLDAPAVVVSYHVQVSMGADAVSGNGATVSGLDLSFSGSPQ